MRGVKGSQIHSPNTYGLPWWFGGKESTCNAGDTGLILGLGRFPGEGNGKPLQFFCPWKSQG